MTQFHRLVLEKFAPDLLNDLDTDDILPHLVGDEAISRDDVDKVNSKATRKEKVGQLLDILPRRGDGAYVSLQTSLLKTDGSEHLYNAMKDLEDGLQYRGDGKPQVFQEPEGTDSISCMNGAENLDVKGLVPILRGRQPQNPSKTLKDPDLMELALGLGEHWEQLGLILGLSRAVIYQCKENNKYNLQSQIFDMLYKWKCKKGKEATVSALVGACKKIELLGEDVYAFLYTL